MRPASLRPQAAPSSTPEPAQNSAAATAQPDYLTNDEAAAFLRLSPRTLEKHRVIGGGPRFRKFGRRVMYARSDLKAWADERSFEATCDPEYVELRGARRAGRR
ncbi:helix-turn-helix domain-containing protein [Xenophilus arseniciresistens]|uniref:Helix-turn-helix domain-containing protein n=1 Tax=Xenophilus arseniciresistens TaxID=1283306 RepID=A0AAE3T016_9BURK|nr:helix-turn-helix domain-containing protein [Xenophilus arseniciresistens]MDA7417110.1 helix-turn-helix domain-containing protein [Xenophilus arseniciresistens]